MKSFLKSSRKAGSRRYLGLIGSLLIEIVDDEPMIQPLLDGGHFSFTPSTASRYSGPDKRLILTTFAHQALLVFNTIHESPAGDMVELTVFINLSQASSVLLLTEAEKLGVLRWSKATLRFKSSLEAERRVLIQAGWQALPNQNEIFERSIGRNGGNTNY